MSRWALTAVSHPVLKFRATTTPIAKALPAVCAAHQKWSQFGTVSAITEQKSRRLVCLIAFVLFLIRNSLFPGGATHDLSRVNCD